jgi:hypothetical protein
MKSHIRALLTIGLLANLHPVAAQSFVLSSSPPTGAFPNSVVATDVNGDGKVDLISPTSATGRRFDFFSG